MKSRASKHVPDGKLVCVDIAYDEVITDVTITGDFFLEPPESREPLQQAIEGKPLDTDPEGLQEAIRAVEARLIGFSAEDLAEVVKEALP